jgi:dTDP-4-dehydrorhamnose 3,5-epimerase
MSTGRFVIEPTPLGGLHLVRRRQFADERGFLSRLFEPGELAAVGWSGPVEQINETGTLKAGTLRGLHFQHPPHAEMKLVSCTRGRIFDVAVDLRAGSPTFLKWFAAELSEENGLALLIPQGFAHGFQALSNDVRMIYVHSAPYDAPSEDGLDALDPRLAIDWPLPAENRSARDLALARAGHDFEGIHL